MSDLRHQHANTRLYHANTGYPLTLTFLTYLEELEALWNNKKLDLAASSALLAAIVSGDPLAMKSAVEDAKDLIRRGAPLLATLEMPLHVAVRGGHLDALKALLSAGAPLEAKDGNGRTALQVNDQWHVISVYGLFRLHYILMSANPYGIGISYI